jgi:hypothetical protein
MAATKKIIFLHHSTGNCIWKGGVPEWIDTYNKGKGTSCQATEKAFPKKEPYGWNNYPFDYWNIWVNHAGPGPFLEEPTLEMLVEVYDLIIFKHCFPVSNILEDTGSPDINSAEKRQGNYRLQYAALKEKMRSFPDTQFLVWTNAALVPAFTNEAEAKRSREFVEWVIREWDEPEDNIFIWDFFELETEGGLYIKTEYANGEKDPHPNQAFSQKTAPLFAQRIIDVLEGRGDTGSITGA